MQEDILELLADEASEYAVNKVLRQEKNLEDMRTRLLEKTGKYYKNSQKLRTSWKQVDEEFKNAA